GAESGVARFNWHAEEAGSAMHAFGEIASLGRGPSPRPVAFHHCLRLRLDQLAAWEGLPFPTHIKIDVDGGELEVLQGSAEILRDARCIGLQVEIIDDDEKCERSAL